MKRREMECWETEDGESPENNNRTVHTNSSTDVPDSVLDDERRNQILQNYSKITQNLEVDGQLLHRLIEKNILPIATRQRIMGQLHSDEDRASALLDYLLKRPIGDYDQFVHCLEQTGKPHIARILRVAETVEESVAQMTNLDTAVSKIQLEEDPVSIDVSTDKLVIERTTSIPGNIRVVLVAPPCDKTILKKVGITCKETWFTHPPDPEGDQKLQLMLRILMERLRQLSSKTFQEDQGISRFTLRHCVVGDEVDEQGQDTILEFLLNDPSDIIYIACNMAQPSSSGHELEEKFQKLRDQSVLLTNASYNSNKEAINFPSHQCISVSCENALGGNRPWGGLVDMVVRTVFQGTDEKGLERFLDYRLHAAVDAVAISIFILQQAYGLGMEESGIGKLKKTRTMRRVLIGLCQSDCPGKHDALRGYGKLKPGLFPSRSDLTEIIKRHLEYVPVRASIAEAHLRKVDYTPAYTEVNKTSLVRQLRSYPVDPAHKVVVGILGSGLNPNHPLLVGRQLDMSSVSVCEREKDQTKDWEDRTTSFTAGLVNLLCTAGGGSLLNRVRLVHVKDIGSDGVYYPFDYNEALKQLLHQGVHVVLHHISRLHQVSTWSGVKLIQRLRDTAVFITPALFMETLPHNTFPQTEILAVSGMTSDGRLSRFAAAGPGVDFVAPMKHQTTGHGRPLPGIHPLNATSFTGAVTIYILVLARIHGVEESRIRRLSTTSVMREILIEMCSHPERRTASMGYGVLDPWPFLNDWTKLGPIVMKYTDPDAEQTLWAGKDI